MGFLDGLLQKQELIKMKTISALVCNLGLALFIFTSVVAEEDHKIPDAPPEYLSMTSPVDYQEVDEAFLKETGKLYKRKCKKCHGVEGDGKGSKAEFFIIKPAAFSAPGYLANRKDGQLFWILMNGSEGTEMEPVGPYSDVGLSEEQLWQLIAYLRRTYTR
jgi:mono/diheme cytochrome c family protein